MASSTLYPYLTQSWAAVQQATWEMAILLVEQGHFTSRERVFAQLSNLSLLNEEHGYDMLRQITAGLVRFSVNWERADGRECTSINYFLQVRYIKEMQGIEAEFNPWVHAEMHQLQQAVLHLRKRGELTPQALSSALKVIAPEHEFDMTFPIKKGTGRSL